jgi:colanic acid biosynthesis glycosyl transferase WcaI
MKRILFVSQNYYPEYSGIAKYSTGLISSWISSGYNITLLTLHPHYPVYKFKVRYLFYSVSKKDNLTIIRCPTIIIGSGLLSKLANQVFFSFFSVPVLIFILFRIQLIFIVIPSGLIALLIILFNFFYKKKIWIHVQDNDLSIFIKMLLGVKSNLFIRYYNNLLSKVNIISTISVDMSKKIISSIVLPNWLDVDLKIWDEARQIKSLTLNSNRFTILFSGTLNKKSNIKSIIIAAKALADIDFIVCGSGPESYLFHLEQIPNLRRLEFLDLKEYYALIKCVNCHLITQISNLDSDLYPSKLLEILLTGKPFIAQTPSSGEFHDIVNKYGVCSYGYTEKSLIDSIILVKNEYEFFLKKSEYSKKYVINFLSKKEILLQFDEQLKNLFKN